MKLMIVTYDLHRPGQRYERLARLLKTATGWNHLLQSTWLIYTSLSPDQWFNKLKPALDDNDRIAIFELGTRRAGWLKQGDWDWIRSKVAKVTKSY